MNELNYENQSPDQFSEVDTTKPTHQDRLRWWVTISL
jgi:hypothetical protein